MERITGLDFLRGLAAFFIVGCHLQLIDYKPSAQRLMWFCDMNVGVFSALAGYLMAGRFSEKIDWHRWGQWCMERVRRLMPSYVVWTFIFLVANIMFQLLVNGTVKHRYFSARFWCNVVIWGSAATHLWFIAALLYSQIIFKAIAFVMRAWMWLIVGVSLVIVAQFWDSWYARYPIRLAAFLALGCGLRMAKGPKAVRCSLFSIALITVGLLLHLFAGRIVPGFVKDFLAVSLLLPGFALLPVTKFAQLSRFLADASMAVYLIHPLVTVMLATIVKKIEMPPYGVATVLVVWIGGWLISFTAGTVIQKSRRLRWMVS